jgi:hypothetical protein
MCKERYSNSRVVSDLVLEMLRIEVHQGSDSVGLDLDSLCVRESYMQSFVHPMFALFLGPLMIRNGSTQRIRFCIFFQTCRRCSVV